MIHGRKQTCVIAKGGRRSCHPGCRYLILLVKLELLYTEPTTSSLQGHSPLAQQLVTMGRPKSTYDWEGKKDALFDLYITQNKSMDEVLSLQTDAALPR